MKQFVDQRRTEREFQVGDMVYLKLQPYRQTFIALKKNLKLSSKYYGLFQVISRIGQVAYKLLLPPDSKVHPAQLIQRGNIVAVKVLVQWSNLPPKDASWEDYDFLKKKFSGFDANP
ncbi:uncharacterized protein LOC142162214 [Nicotiana tabacum]|uniref:Uncharacterized protein LOC142162214 n=1 Tax=Nicotiana tabacum TaxID=4097 RepID=A0AC58RPI0_TOBAC